MTASTAERTDAAPCFDSTDPHTGLVTATHQGHDAATVDRLLDAADAAQATWRDTPLSDRLPVLRRAADLLRERRARYAALITAEMGKPVTEAEAEVDKCARTLEFYAEHAPGWLADTPVETDARESRVGYEPLGLVLAVMPWNYPFWQYVRFAAPALAAGNAPVLKHAANVSGCARALAELVRDAGAPEGLAPTLLVDSASVAGLIADDRIAAVTLTGSTRVGAIVAAQAGAALKPQVLELGGSDPFLVLADADVEAAAEAAVTARFLNTGQSCVNAKRFLVHEDVADAFVAAFARRVEGLRLGDPTDRDTQVGPLARADLRDTLHGQVTRSLDAGAVLVTGGRPGPGPGHAYRPTVLDHVRPEHAAAAEETFGPVAAVIRVADTAEALRLANATEFGLGASVWTADVQAARDLARRLQAGAVAINGIVASDPRLPFGGVKRSGYGRELGLEGLRAFVNVQAVSVHG